MTHCLNDAVVPARTGLTLLDGGHMVRRPGRCAITQVGKGPFAKTPHAHCQSLARVSHDDPRVCRGRGRPPGWAFQCVLNTLGWWLTWNLQRKLSNIQVAGFNRFRAANNHFSLSGPVLWLFSHTDEPGDAELLAGLYSVFPRVADGGHRVMPSAVLRECSHFWSLEYLFTKVILGPVAIHQDLKKHPRGSAEEMARRAANRRKLRLGAQRVIERGGHMIAFPEGKVNGNGLVQIPAAIGAIEAFRRTPHGDQYVTVIPVGITYEELGCDKRQACMNLGPPCILEDVPGLPPAAFLEAVRGDMEQALAQQNTLTLSGIIGEYALTRRAALPHRPVHLTAAKMNAIIGDVVEAVQAAHAGQALTPLNELVLDQALCDPLRRMQRCTRAAAQLRERGQLDADGFLRSVGPMVDLQAPAEGWKKLPSKLHRTDPLCYWGNRVRQQALLPALRDILRNAAARVDLRHAVPSLCAAE